MAGWGAIPVRAAQDDEAGDDDAVAATLSEPGLIDALPWRLTARAGLLFTEHETLARVDSELLGQGSDVDVERDLGLEERTRDVRFDVALGLGRRHQLQVGYLSLSRAGRTTLQTQIQFGDQVFPADVGVESLVELRLVPVAYRFAVVRSDRVDLGLSAGVLALFTEAGVEAVSAGVAERESAEFPLPVVGLDGVIGLAPRLYGTGGVKYFAIEVDGIEGSWREFRASLEYFPLAHVGLGAGWRFIRLEADGTEGLLSRPEGTLLLLDYEFAGPHLYLTLGL